MTEKVSPCREPATRDPCSARQTRSPAPLVGAGVDMIDAGMPGVASARAAATLLVPAVNACDVGHR